MTADFDRAVELLLRHEGGYVNHPRDPGKETKYGISKAAFPHVDVKNLTLAQAKEIYRTEYWDRFRCGELAWPLAYVLFDCVVQSSPSNPVRWLQRVIGETPDGVFGPKTLAAAKACKRPALCALGIITERAEYRTTLKTYDVFGRGWRARDLEVIFNAVRGWDGE